MRHRARRFTWALAAAFLGCRGAAPIDAPDGAPSSSAVLSAPPSSGAPMPPGRIAVGDRHTCFVRASGRVACWGDNSKGQLGNGALAPSATPVEVRGVEGAVRVAAFANRTCATTAGGKVVCWGGAGVAPPSVVPDVDDAIQIAMNRFHDCALLRAGKVVCWGTGFVFEGSPMTPEKARTFLAGIDDAVQVERGCLLRRGGTVECWGLDGTTDPHKTPARVGGLDDAVRIAVAETHACALRRTGEVVCWGRGDVGQLGAGEAPNRNVPAPVPGVRDAIAIAAGGFDTCALRSTGEAVCWGGSLYGELCEHRDDHPGFFVSGTCSTRPTPVPGLPAAIDLAAGPSHACALFASGEVACWGDNLEGQLGGGFAGRSGDWVTVEGISDAVQVAAENDFACARRKGGEIACWGSNRVGQLGDGTRKGRGVAAPVIGVARASHLAVSAETACVVEPPGIVMCWGLGALGDFGKAQRITKVSDAIAVTTKNHRICAVRRSGRITCAGEQNQDIETTGGAKLRDAIASELSAHGGCAVRRSGALVCWGIGSVTAMAPGHEPRPAPPPDAFGPQELRGIGDVKGIGFSHSFACLLRASGRAHCWSAIDAMLLPSNPLPPEAEVAGLSDGKRIDGLLVTRATGEVVELTPEPERSGYVARAVMPAIHDAVQAAGSSAQGCAVRRTGEVVCWGDDSMGQLGTGTRGRSPKPIRVVGIGP